jgi:TIR domain
MTVPRAFISYSHDSQSHKKWVLDLAVRLRNSGVDAILDQWELQPGDDIPHFMETNLAAADRVLMVCTENYVIKANSGTGGVGYEKMIVTSDLMKSIDSNKIVPIVRQAGTKHVPTFLKSKLFIDFSQDSDLEFSFDELLRALVGAPLFKKPPLGNNPFKPVSETVVERTADAVVDLIRVVVSQFEKTTQPWVLYSHVVSHSRISRILLDMTIKQAVSQRLIELDDAGDLYLTDAGKHFAIEHKLTRR